jgi:hypothetical protein
MDNDGTYIIAHDPGQESARAPRVTHRHSGVDLDGAMKKSVCGLWLTSGARKGAIDCVEMGRIPIAGIRAGLAGGGLRAVENNGRRMENDSRESNLEGELQVIRDSSPHFLRSVVRDLLCAIGWTR